MEHTMGRNAIQGMSDALEKYKAGDPLAAAEFVSNARNYIGLLNVHIHKENTILFAMADRSLSADQQEELVKQFDALEEERIGPGKHEEFHDLLRRLKAVYLPT